MISRFFGKVFVGVILAYRWTLSPVLGGQCRFEPTCSAYGLEAVRTHGPWRGGWLTLKRLARCQPFAKGGYDPVPVGLGPNHEDAKDGNGPRMNTNEHE